MTKSRVAIIGVGLMGGSLGLALVRQKKWRVTGVGRKTARLEKAKALGSVHDFTTDLRRGVEEADVVVIGAPVGDIVSLAKKIKPFLKKDCLVMDVGSVKEPIVSALEKIFTKGPWFVGVHPMAGSEKTGVEFALPGLYAGATCVVTPTGRTPEAAVRRAERFWRGIGGKTIRLAPEKHDQWVALVSHLPHLLAESLVLTAGRAGNPGLVKTLAAGSFRDMTRVAGADPALWSEIFLMNDAHIRRVTRIFQNTLKRLAESRSRLALLRKVQSVHRQFK